MLFVFYNNILIILKYHYKNNIIIRSYYHSIIMIIWYKKNNNIFIIMYNLIATISAIKFQGALIYLNQNLIWNKVLYFTKFSVWCTSAFFFLSEKIGRVINNIF